MILREMGVFERALLLSDQHQPFNIVGVVMLENPPAPEILHQAFLTLQSRHPFLQARIEGVSYVALPEPGLPFRAVAREDGTMWKEIVEREMRTRLDSSDGLLRVTYLHGVERAELILTCHHSLMDGTSGMNLVDELLCACISCAPLPGLTVGPSPETRFPPAYQGWRGALSKMRYMAAQMGEEMKYRMDMRGKRKAPIHLGGSGFIETLILPEPVVDLVSRACRQNQITLHSLLQAVLLTAVNRVVYQRQAMPMRFITFANLRPYTIPPANHVDLGNYIAMMRYTIRVSETKNLFQLAREINDQVHLSLKSGQKFTASQLSENVMRMLIGMKSMRMANTAVNYGGVVKLQPQYGDIRLNGLHAFNSSFDLGPEAGSQAWLFNDALWWDFMFLETDMSRETAGRIVAEARSLLELAAEGINPPLSAPAGFR